MFPSIRSVIYKVLDLATRGVVALEGILDAISLLRGTIHGTLKDPALFQPVSEPVAGLADAVARLALVQQELGPAAERLDALELSRVRWEAECEGLLLKAEGKHNAAKSAEQRERKLSRSYARDIADPFPPVGGEEPSTEGEFIHADNGGGGEARQVPTVRAAVAPSPHALRLRAKWGV